MDFTLSGSETFPQPEKPIVAIDASDTSFAEADTARPAGPSGAGSAHAVVTPAILAASASAGPSTRSAPQSERADRQGVTSIPADRDDRVATARASTGLALPYPGDPVAINDVPGHATADRQGSPDTAVDKIPPGQEKQNGREGDDEPGKGKEENEQPVSQVEESDPHGNVKRDESPAHANGHVPPARAGRSPDEANHASAHGNGPPAHVPGPPPHANAAPRRRPQAQATAQALPSAVEPTDGNTPEAEGPPGPGNREPTGHPHGGPPGGPPEHLANEPPGQANPTLPTVATEQSRPHAEQGRPTEPGPPAQSVRPPVETQAANRQERSTAKPDAVPPKPPPKPATERSGQEKPKPPDQMREKPKQSSKQNTNSAGSGNRREPPKPAPSNDSKSPKKK
jgi:hypothetical protein